MHIPFCEKKCFYCSFVVSVGQQHRMDSYLDCLAKEAKQYKGAKVKTIYIGGGTPTFMNNQQIEKLITIGRKNFNFDNDVEFTMEANPEGLDRTKAKLLKDLGINRVSVGMQSLNDKYLKFLGRCHDRQQAVRAFANLREAGHDNINLDLMYSFPGQTDEEIEEDVRGIAQLGSEHLSLYTLTIEEHSRFYVQKLKLEEDCQAEHYVLVTELLNQYGFQQYEVSNFAKMSRQSLHNLNYWMGGNYIGLGVGAHSHRDGKRWWNVSRLNLYMQRIDDHERVIENCETLTEHQRLLEAMLLGLRMNQGIKIKEIEQSIGCLLEEDKRKMINEFVREGFMIWEGDSLRINLKGRLVLDELCSRLI